MTHKDCKESLASEVLTLFRGVLPSPVILAVSGNVERKQETETCEMNLRNSMTRPTGTNASLRLTTGLATQRQLMTSRKVTEFVRQRNAQAHAQTLIYFSQTQAKVPKNVPNLFYPVALYLRDEVQI